MSLKKFAMHCIVVSCLANKTKERTKFGSIMKNINIKIFNEYLFSYTECMKLRKSIKKYLSVNRLMKIKLVLFIYRTT